MNKIIAVIIAGMLSACATAGDAYLKSKSLDYESKPADALVIEQARKMIRPHLKDPDSLKNLSIVNNYKCYASKMGVTDNVSPKYNYGYWCYNFKYQATNSYGGYVGGDKFAVYAKGRLQNINRLGETVRKFDDLYMYHSPQ